MPYQHIRQTTAPLAGAIAAALASAPAHAADSPDALMAAFSAAVEAQDADALGALYVEDAVSFGPGGGTSIGPAEIAAGWVDFFSGFDDFSVSLESLGTHDSGDAHAAWGYWTMSAIPVDGDERVTWQGRYTDVSVKTEAGWRYIADHASMRADASSPE